MTRYIQDTSIAKISSKEPIPLTEQFITDVMDEILKNSISPVASTKAVRELGLRQAMDNLR